MVEIDAHIFKSPAFEGIVNKAIEFFNNTPVHPLPPDNKFEGTGVYALYYTGNFELYQPITQQNSKHYKQPIYVGKAVPRGWRTARQPISGTTNELYRRLCEHANNIRQVTNLKLQDFHARFMILSGINFDLVVPVEAELIRRYKP
ncbi:MAG: Eco29kI family restriction endonuclease [Sedimentisphaerales bacterium]